MQTQPDEIRDKLAERQKSSNGSALIHSQQRMFFQ
jgi:hypothetical protein